jgi:hypothetical protein
MYTHPVIFFTLLKIWTIVTIPYRLFIKIFDDGIYEIDVFDKNQKIIKVGYMWCYDESRYNRWRRVRRDLKLRNNRDFKLPSRYSIKFKKINAEKDTNGTYKLIIWTNPDFTLCDTPEKRGIISYFDWPINIIKNLFVKKFDNLSPVVLLSEIAFLNKKNECLIKSFVFTKQKKLTPLYIQKMIVDDLKSKEMYDLIKNTKYLNAAYHEEGTNYKKETHIVWSI